MHATARMHGGLKPPSPIVTRLTPCALAWPPEASYSRLCKLRAGLSFSNLSLSQPQPPAIQGNGALRLSVSCMNGGPSRRMNEQVVDTDENGHTALNNTLSALFEMGRVIVGCGTSFIFLSFPCQSIVLVSQKALISLLDTVAVAFFFCLFQTAAENSCWGCVTKYSNSFLASAQS